jgi:hypothetical protein
VRRAQEGSYDKDKYHRLKARRGSLRAAMAIGHKILVAAFHILAKGVPFQDLGDVFLDQQARQRTTTNLVRRLNTLGYDVALRHVGARIAAGGDLAFGVVIKRPGRRSACRFAPCGSGP